jgi:hypothetical protein
MGIKGGEVSYEELEFEVVKFVEEGLRELVELVEDGWRDLGRHKISWCTSLRRSKKP